MDGPRHGYRPVSGGRIRRVCATLAHISDTVINAVNVVSKNAWKTSRARQEAGHTGGSPRRTFGYNINSGNVLRQIWPQSGPLRGGRG